jgi:antitoxin component of RelBE/YafQ-DinJ toxin-antitoxin module
MVSKTHFMNVRLDDESYSRYKACAEKLGLRTSAYVRLVLDHAADPDITRFELEHPEIIEEIDRRIKYWLNK